MSAFAQQLLWIETLLKGVGGMVLCVLPLTTARVVGLPVAASGFWPRTLGAILLGLAVSTFIEGSQNGQRGLGLDGLIAINLAGALMVMSLLMARRAATTRRGRFTLWLLCCTLLTLAGLEFIAA